MFPCFDLPHGKTPFNRQFWLGKVGFDAFQEQVVAQGFCLCGYELPGAESLLEIPINDLYGALCNSQQLTQPPLPLRLQSTPRVGGGSAFFVRQRSHTSQKYENKNRINHRSSYRQPLCCFRRLWTVSSCEHHGSTSRRRIAV